jgi:hypothetical protein
LHDCGQALLLISGKIAKQFPQTAISPYLRCNFPLFAKQFPLKNNLPHGSMMKESFRCRGRYQNLPAGTSTAVNGRLNIRCSPSRSICSVPAAPAPELAAGAIFELIMQCFRGEYTGKIAKKAGEDPCLLTGSYSSSGIIHRSRPDFRFSQLFRNGGGHLR